MAKIVTRMNYYNGLFLKEEDFKLEQDYHIRLHRLHNRYLHHDVYGVAEGLEVSRINSTKTLRITKGIAIAQITTEDGENHAVELVLPDDTTVVDLSTLSAGSEAYITISYEEVLKEIDKDKGEKEIHILEKPKTEAILISLSNNPKEKIRLAKVKIPARTNWTSEDVDIDPSVRNNARILAFEHTHDGKDSEKIPGIDEHLTNTSNPHQVTADQIGAIGTKHIADGAITTDKLAKDARIGKATDADTVDGKHATDFAASAHVHDNRYYHKKEIEEKLQDPIDTARIKDGTVTSAKLSIDDLLVNGNLKVVKDLIVGGKIQGKFDIPDELKVKGLQVYGYVDLGLGIANSHFPYRGDGYAYVSGKAIILRGDEAGKYAEKMRIAENGNVGIGTTEPSQKLDVIGNAVANNLSLSRDNNNRGALYLACTGDFNHAIYNNYSNIDRQGAWDGARWNVYAGLDIRVGASRTPVLSVRDSGNVGIGTTNPGAKLQVSGGAIMPAEGNSENAGILFPKDAFGGGGDRAWIRYYARSGESTTFEIGTSNDADDHIALMASGNVGIGTTNPSRKLEVAGSICIGAGETFYSPGRMHIHGEELLYLLNKSGVVIGKEWGGNGNLTVQGNAFKPGGGSWGTISDKRLKKNIKPLEGALEKLLKLRGVSYEWREPEKQGNLVGMQMGLIAQEVEKVFPEWIDTDADGYKTLTVRGFESLVIEVIRELRNTIMDLQQKIAK